MVKWMHTRSIIKLIVAGVVAAVVFCLFHFFGATFVEASWRGILYFFGSGSAFFLGAVLVVAGLTGRMRTTGKSRDRLCICSVGIGFIFVAASAAPLPYTWYAIAGVLAFALLATEKSERPWWRQRRPWVRGLTLGAWVLTIANELQFQFVPTVHSTGGEVFVIGDSITAGLRDKIVPWPELLARKRELKVVNLAQAGATTAVAMSQAGKLPEHADIVIIEIGGNDLFRDTPAEEFAADLDALLRLVTSRSDQVVMFELPLPPLCNEYGRAQRRVVARHNVRLIPKRCLMSVLASNAGTSDLVHLTQEGHRRLTEMASPLID